MSGKKRLLYNGEVQERLHRHRGAVWACQRRAEQMLADHDVMAWLLGSELQQLEAFNQRLREITIPQTLEDVNAAMAQGADPVNQAAAAEAEAADLMAHIADLTRRSARRGTLIADCQALQQQVTHLSDELARQRDRLATRIATLVSDIRHEPLDSSAEERLYSLLTGLRNDYGALHAVERDLTLLGNLVADLEQHSWGTSVAAKGRAQRRELLQATTTIQAEAVAAIYDRLVIEAHQAFEIHQRESAQQSTEQMQFWSRQRAKLRQMIQDRQRRFEQLGPEYAQDCQAELSAIEALFTRIRTADLAQRDEELNTLLGDLDHRLSRLPEVLRQARHQANTRRRQQAAELSVLRSQLDQLRQQYAQTQLTEGLQTWVRSLLNDVERGMERLLERLQTSASTGDIDANIASLREELDRYAARFDSWRSNALMRKVLLLLEAQGQLVWTDQSRSHLHAGSEDELVLEAVSVMQGDALNLVAVFNDDGTFVLEKTDASETAACELFKDIAYYLEQENVRRGLGTMRSFDEFEEPLDTAPPDTHRQQRSVLLARCQQLPL